MMNKRIFFVSTFMIAGALLAQSNRYQSGATREEGWIVQKTREGIVKIPKKQYFSFSGTDVQGRPYTPTQGVLGQRPPRRNTSLIPERLSYRQESLSTSGYEGK